MTRPKESRDEIGAKVIRHADYLMAGKTLLDVRSAANSPRNWFAT